jgi:8-oxo-dGTP pyrophosphatase MutT (NUDIX family)
VSLIIPKFCENCGKQYILTQIADPYREEDGSHECRFCGHKRWDNPLPVVVCVQSVAHWSGGLAIARRAIEPRIGTWNLIGGHISNGETAEEAAIREWREETSIEPGRVTGLSSSYANGKGHILIAVHFTPIPYDRWQEARLCKENDAFSLWFGAPCDPVLGFPIHQEIAKRWKA